MRPPPELTVTFVGQVHQVEAEGSEGLVFGRGAALDIDSNPFLHRRVGRFVHCDGRWWVENLSGWTSIRIEAGGASTILPPQSRTALDHEESVVRFDAGACTYEVTAALPPAALHPAPAAAPTGHVTATLRPLTVPLNDEQRLLVVALSESRLRNPSARYQLPTSQSLSRRLGWNRAKFNRKLDYLCNRLDRVGVPGMKADGRRATDRRSHLVEHMVSTGQVTADDLCLLDDYPPLDRTAPT